MIEEEIGGMDEMKLLLLLALVLVIINISGGQECMEDCKVICMKLKNANDFNCDYGCSLGCKQLLGKGFRPTPDQPHFS